MQSIGILIALLGVLALYCIYMILNISSGQMTPDETPLDYLSSSYQVKFFVQQNLTELLLVSIVLLSLCLLFAVWCMHGQNANKEKNCLDVKKMHIGTCHNINPNSKNAC